MNEKENTFRALKDLPPVVTGFWCRFNFHKWTKWSDIKRNGGGIYTKQERYCVNCNKFDEWVK